MKKNTLIAAIALVTMGNSAFAQEEVNTVCMSEPQRVEISSREIEYTCDALDGGEAVLATRLNSSFARYFLDGTRKAIITDFGGDNNIRPFSRRSTPFTDNDQALIEELLAAFTADTQGDSQPEGSSSNTNVSSATASVTSNGDTNTTDVETSTSGNASVNGSTNTNGVEQNISDSSGNAPQVAEPTQSAPAPSNGSGASVRITANSTDGVTNVDTATNGNASINGTVSNNGETQSVSESSSLAPQVTEPTQSAPAPSNGSGASVRITANSTDGVTNVDTATNGNASINGTVSNNGETQSVSDASGSLASSEAAPVAPTQRTEPRRGASNATVTISSNSSNGTTIINSNTSGNASVRGTVTNNGNTSRIDERSGSLPQEQGNLDSAPTSTETTTQRSGRTVSSARVTSSANSNGDIETNVETVGNVSGSAQASGGGNSETVSF